MCLFCSQLFRSFFCKVPTHSLLLSLSFLSFNKTNGERKEMRETTLPLSPFYAYAAMTLLPSTPAFCFPLGFWERKPVTFIIMWCCCYSSLFWGGSITSLVLLFFRGGEGCREPVQLLFVLTCTSKIFFCFFSFCARFRSLNKHLIFLTLFEIKQH